MRTIIHFLSDENGATSIEYAILASCVALAIIVTVNGLGSKLKTSYTSVASVL